MKTNTDLIDLMLTLSKESLAETFRFVDLQTQVRFSMHNTTFKNAFVLNCQRYGSVLHRHEYYYLKEAELKFFFETVGKYVKTVLNLPNQMKEKKNFISFLNKHCHNVEKMRGFGTKLLTEDLHHLFANMPRLTSLKLASHNLTNDAMLEVSKVTTLESLAIRYEPKVTGEFLDKLVNLKSVTFVKSSIEDWHLIDICKAAKHLKRIRLSGCSRITYEAINALPECCPELEILVIEDMKVAELSPIARLPKLTKLTVDDNNFYRIIRLLDALAVTKSEQLQFLRIGSHDLKIILEYLEELPKFQNLKLFALDSLHNANDFIDSKTIQYICQLKHLEVLCVRSCTSITNGNILEILDSCKKLKYINVPFCNEITVDVIYHMIPLLEDQKRRELRQTSDLPVYMLVRGTGIFECQNYPVDDKLLRLKDIHVLLPSLFTEDTNTPTTLNLKCLWANF